MKREWAIWLLQGHYYPAFERSLSTKHGEQLWKAVSSKRALAILRLHVKYHPSNR